MSNYRRFSLSNNLLHLNDKAPILNNYTLYDNFPIGLMIISKVQPIVCNNNKSKKITKKNNESKEMEIKVKYINQQASELFELKDSDNDKKIHEQIKQFKKFEKNQTTDETLDNILFDKNRKDEYYGSFKSHGSLIFVKYKLVNENLFICSDYYNDERKIIQNQLFQGLKFQYIATLFHELYNPINSLLFMLNINQNEDGKNKNIDNKDISSILNNEELNNSLFCDDINLNDEENEKLNIQKISKVNELYKEKLISFKEKEKDIGVLINMIYIFLENLMLYLKINLGVDMDEKKEEEKENIISSIGESNFRNSSKNLETSNPKTDSYINNVNKNKKLNLEFSFNKILNKLSYLFKFKCIKYPEDFSYLSNKYTLTDETVFFDFLGQIYSFLYYIIPKSDGFELSYSIINDNKIKIIFKKYNFKNKGLPMLKKRKHSVLFILCEDKFKATKTVKTSEMTKEILFKLSEVLGIKLKIMEYENIKEDKYLTIILPFFIEENKLNAFKSDIYRSSLKDRNSIYNSNINSKTSSQNYLNPNFAKFNFDKRSSYLTENIEEINSSEEDAKSSHNNINNNNNNNNNNINLSNDQNSLKENKNKIRDSLISKQSRKKGRFSITTNIQKADQHKPKSPINDKKYSITQIDSKKISSKYLNEIDLVRSKFDNNVSKDTKDNQNIKDYDNTYPNTLILIHKKYSYIERLRSSGVEILIENNSENLNKNNNNSLYLESIDSNDNNTSIRDKKSINAEVDSDNFIEIEYEDEYKDKNNEMNSITQNLDKFNISNSISSNNNINSNRVNNNNIKNDKLNLNNNKSVNDSLFGTQKVSANNGKEDVNSKQCEKCDCKDILLVDDDEYICKTFKNILKKFKLEADSAENGQECLNMIIKKQEKNCQCSKNKYKLILMDITMPVMDGIEAAKNIQKMIDEHKLYDTVKIIFISAHVNLDLSNILSGIKCAIDYYAKPINADKYKSLLDKYYYSK